MSFAIAAVRVDPNRVASFSSAGPPVGLGIKPEVLAVGENFYTATQSFDVRGDMYTQPVVYNGLDVVLDAANTSAQLEYAGLYRLVASDGAIPNIVVAAIQNTVPSGIISLGK